MTAAPEPSAPGERTSDATPGQRHRSAALVVAMVALAGVGAIARVPLEGTPPPPCAAPTIVGGVLGCEPEGAPAGARVWLMGAKLDVNVARIGELEAIPGVGPSMARAIVNARAARGHFGTIEDLDEIEGVGPKTLANFRAFLEVRQASDPGR